jgi:hypothetical protein
MTQREYDAKLDKQTLDALNLPQAVDIPKWDIPDTLLHGESIGIIWDETKTKHVMVLILGSTNNNHACIIDNKKRIIQTDEHGLITNVSTYYVNGSIDRPYILTMRRCVDFDGPFTIDDGYGGTIKATYLNIK